MKYLPLIDLLPKQVFDELLAVSTDFKINTPLRLAHFLAQCAHESGNFQHVEENLYYPSARLRVVFPKYFSISNSEHYANNPQLIANRVYANRMGNGDEGSGDGYKFRGRGYIQLTGRDNYAAFDLCVPESLIAAPEYVATKYPLLSAAWFWDENNLNMFADEDDTMKITRKINGGLNGLDDREKYFDRYYSVLKDANN